MGNAIDDLGGVAEVARICNVKPPSVSEWKRRGQIPRDQCPVLERASKGGHSCEQLAPTAQWVRIPDPDWPWHPQGRPLLDLTRGPEAATHQPAAPSAAHA